jgi:GntR family transcriptional regulator
MSSLPFNADAPSPPPGGVGALTPAFSPLYQQIKGLILQSLQQGEWKPGEAIPSEMDLAARFRVSQGTVRKAIDELAADNLVMRRQGKGTFVATHAEQHVQYRFLKLLPDTGDASVEGPAQRTVLDCRRVRASADVARALALRSGDPVVQARRICRLPACPPFWKTSGCPARPSRA